MCNCSEFSKIYRPLSVSCTACACCCLIKSSSCSFSSASCSRALLVAIISSFWILERGGAWLQVATPTQTEPHPLRITITWLLRIWRKWRSWSLETQVDLHAENEKKRNYCTSILNLSYSFSLSFFHWHAGVGKTSLIHLICRREVLSNPSWTVGCNVEVKV